MSFRFRHAICNEAFEQCDFRDACRAIRNAGYTGIELAPFTLAETPAQVSLSRRSELRDIMASEGLDFVGLHWLMVGPTGLHATGPHAELRRKSWDHIRALIDLSADLAVGQTSRSAAGLPAGQNSGPVLVFGSPKARCTTGGLTRDQATRHFVEGFVSVAHQAEERGVTVLVEALPGNQCDVVQTMAEAVAIVEEIASPAIRTMFDVHNTLDETEPHDVLVDRYFDYIRHVHVNELDGKHCGTGGYDYKPVLNVLRRRGYTGWISLEAFDFSYGAERLANESLRHLEQEITRLAA